MLSVVQNVAVIVAWRHAHTCTHMHAHAGNSAKVWHQLRRKKELLARFQVFN